jgi:hypothetical protein
MECASNDLLCAIEQGWNFITSEKGRALIWQFLKDIAAIIGVALAALKWYENRESVVFRRLSGLLGEQAQRTKQALSHVLQMITRPGPADPPKMPSFAEAPLRALLKRRHWTPVLAFAGPLTSADRKLNRTHRRLDKRQDTASRYQIFINEQRFAAHMLQGAIASARSERASTEHRLNQLTTQALDSFQKASRVPGKSDDLNSIELIGIHLRKLGQIDVTYGGSAPATFEMLAEKARTQRDALDDTQMERREELTFVISRAVRYQAELLHSDDIATASGRDLLNSIEPSLNTGNQLSWSQLLDRARFYEVDACIRVHLHGYGPVTTSRISAARRDYEELKKQCDPKNWSWPDRVWRIAARLFRRDGVKDLLREANAGLEQIDAISRGEGCRLCRSRQTATAPTSNAAPLPSNSTPQSPSEH